jgi:hypothetical protein
MASQKHPATPVHATPEQSGAPSVATPSPAAITQTENEVPAEPAPSRVAVIVGMLNDSDEETKHDSLHNDDRSRLTAAAPEFLTNEDERSIGLYSQMAGISPSAYRSAFLHGVWFAARRFT